MILFGTPVMVYDDLLKEDYRQSLVSAAKEVQNNVKDTTKTWLCDVYSTCHDYTLNDDPFFRDLLLTQYEKVKHFLGTHEVADELMLSSSWLNSYTAKQFQDWHKHPVALVSCVYYLEAPEGSAPLTFHAPYVPDVGFDRTSGKYFSVTKQIKAATNRLIVFPSWLPHSVPQGTNEEPRWSVASNYKVGVDE